MFEYGGGSSSGGGNGGGSGSPGRYSPAGEGGPGVNVTITPDEVPMAQLPGVPINTMLIDDGEIPLVGLPKTGQSSDRTTLTLMLSGIFMVIASMGKKRKKKES